MSNFVMLLLIFVTVTSIMPSQEAYISFLLAVLVIVCCDV
jgi:hypothetical protein